MAGLGQVTGRRKYAMRARATSPTPDMTTSWGLSFIPGVSSSKKRKSPALAAGIGASSRRLFSRLLNSCFLLPVLGADSL